MENEIKNEIKKMDKMTHAKFNLDNFLLSFSSTLDNAVEKNRFGVAHDSLRTVYIALKIGEFNEFSKENLSDILGYSIMKKHFSKDEIFNQLPLKDKTIFQNKLLEDILLLSSEVENNISVSNQFVINKSYLIECVEKLAIDEIVKENFFYLADMESFWLDLLSSRLPFFILDLLDDNTLEISYEDLLKIAQMISKIVYKYTNRTYNQRIIETLGVMAKVYLFDSKDSARILLCGYLYNIGILKIPQELFLKVGTLDEVEYDMIKSIPYFTKETLSMVYGFDDVAKLTATFQERIDGSGYPYHVEGNDLALKDRLLAIAIFDQALSEERSYRKAFNEKERCDLLLKKAKDGQLDISIVKDFIDNLYTPRSK